MFLTAGSMITIAVYLMQAKACVLCFVRNMSHCFQNLGEEGSGQLFFLCIFKERVPQM